MTNSSGYLERWTDDCCMRCLTRLPNPFSKQLENHAAMVALDYMYCIFGRLHQTLRATPVMEPGDDRAALRARQSPRNAMSCGTVNLVLQGLLLRRLRQTWHDELARQHLAMVRMCRRADVESSSTDMWASLWPG